jgi:SAM-dependent methyltransferase
MRTARSRYEDGAYSLSVEDGYWKARQLARLLSAIPEKASVRKMADVGCGPGAVLAQLRVELLAAGFSLDRVVGYDLAPFPPGLERKYPDIIFRRGDFLDSDERFDLVTLNDVAEHVPQPQRFLARVAERARYVALHMPLDDRWSVLLRDQWNYRIGPIGHISFWNPATALNCVTSSGIVPLACRFTPGFLAPSGRERLSQWLALPARALMWLVSPGLTAMTVGGVSLAILGEGNAAEASGAAASGSERP